MHQTIDDMRAEGYRPIPFGKNINELTEQQIIEHLNTLRIHPDSVRIFIDMLGHKYIVRKTGASVKKVLGDSL